MSTTTNSIKNLWGNLPEAPFVRTPAGILNEQAQVLAKETKGLLTGRTEIERKGEDFVITMDIVATSLGNYTYEVLRIKYGVDLYPARLLPWDEDDTAVDCTNPEELEQAIANVLQSHRVRRVITGLLAQLHYNRVAPFLSPLG